MLRNFLLPESIARADGTGPEIDLGSKRGKLLVLYSRHNSNPGTRKLGSHRLGFFRRRKVGFKTAGQVPPQVLLRPLFHFAEFGIAIRR